MAMQVHRIYHFGIITEKSKTCPFSGGFSDCGLLYLYPSPEKLKYYKETKPYYRKNTRRCLA